MTTKDSHLPLCVSVSVSVMLTTGPLDSKGHYPEHWRLCPSISPGLPLSAVPAWAAASPASAPCSPLPTAPQVGGTWQVEALLLPRALWGWVQGGRRRGTWRERGCR